MTENKWKSKVGTSQSFTTDEVLFMDNLLTGWRQGADLSAFIRHPLYARIAAKFLKMRQKSEARKPGGTNE